MSTQATHSCGPWEFDGKKIVSPDRYVCSVDDWSAQSVPGEYDKINRALHDEAQANARLISAAPEMLEALRVTLHRAEQARHSSEQPGPILAEWLDGIIAEARAAIAKAEGRAGE